jgi:hypothetical protein
VKLARSKAVLDLGKRVAAQLANGDDLLAHWMAHHIAELIKAAEEEAEPEVRSAAEETCARAIVELWERRHSMPSNPLAELEPILRTLSSLDVDRDQFRYFPGVLRQAVTTSADGGAKRWLDLALELDYSARLLIQYALRAAAANARENVGPWIELATKTGEDELLEVSVIRFVSSGQHDGAADTRVADAAIAQKLSRLERFIELAQQQAAEMRGQLASSSDSPDPESV